MRGIKRTKGGNSGEPFHALLRRHCENFRFIITHQRAGRAGALDEIDTFKRFLVNPSAIAPSRQYGSPQ